MIVCIWACNLQEVSKVSGTHAAALTAAYHVAVGNEIKWDVVQSRMNNKCTIHVLS
jgi:hypothetical protein